MKFWRRHLQHWVNQDQLISARWPLPLQALHTISGWVVHVAEQENICEVTALPQCPLRIRTGPKRMSPYILVVAQSYIFGVDCACHLQEPLCLLVASGGMAVGVRLDEQGRGLAATFAFPSSLHCVHTMSLCCLQHDFADLEVSGKRMVLLRSFWVCQMPAFLREGCSCLRLCLSLQRPPGPLCCAFRAPAGGGDPTKPDGQGE